MMPDVARTEAALLSRAAHGDEEAVEALYRSYAAPLFGFGLRRLGRAELAEELVQVVMTRLWQTAGRYDPARGSVRTWVYALARNAVIDLHRKQARVARQIEPPDDLAVADELDALLRAEAMRAALERLTTEHREVLELAYFRSLSQREIAEELDLPVGTVKSRTYYALKALRLACDELGVHP